MSTSIIPFCFESNSIRVIQLDGDPWFVAKDVCHVLGHGNPSVAVSSLDDDERAKKSLGRQGDTWVISESGLYTLIIRSNKQQAKPFRRWVTKEVLPQIRKTGSYATARQLDADLEQTIRGAVRAELAAERKRHKIEPWVLDMLSRNDRENMTIIYTALPMIDSGIPFSWTINSGVFIDRKHQ